jgi:transcriptional regulator with XRE-family HTH domain
MKKVLKQSDDLYCSNFDNKNKYSNEKLIENLNKLLEEHKISINQLHKNTGIPVTTIKRIKYDKDANPTISSLLPIAEFFSVSLNQLIGLEDLPEKDHLGVYVEKQELWTKVPVIQWGDIINFEKKELDFTLCNFISTDAEVSEYAFALLVEEDNWTIFQKRMKLIFDMKKEAKHRNYVLILNLGSTTVSFYQLLCFDGLYYLKPPQADYKTIEYNKSKHSLKGTMVQARMDQD